jgi:hypothetical protein
MTKWEYKEIKKETVTPEMEKQLGEQGWELVTVSNDANSFYSKYIFKRPIEIEKTHDSYNRDGR